MDNDQYEALGCKWWHQVHPHPGDIYKGDGYMLSEKQANLVWGMIGRIVEAALAGAATLPSTPTDYKLSELLSSASCLLAEERLLAAIFGETDLVTRLGVIKQSIEDVLSSLRAASVPAASSPTNTPEIVQYFCDNCDPSQPCLECENRNRAELSHHAIPPTLLERVEAVLGVLPCEECEHSLALHFDRNGCEYERGDRQVQEVGAVAMGPCGCKAENLSDDGNDAFLLLRDILQMRLLNSIAASSPETNQGGK